MVHAPCAISLSALMPLSKHMKHSILLSLLLALTSMGAQADGSHRYTMQHRLADGTAISVNVNANGRFTSYTLSDGTPLVRQTDGRFCYARLSDGRILSSGIEAHEASGRSTMETQWLASRNVDAQSVAEALAARYPCQPLSRTTRSFNVSNNGLGTFGESGSGAVSSIGSPVIPVVMVEFADREFEATSTDEKFSRYFNEQGYADEQGSRGSVRDYFVAQSNGAFQPEFRIVARVKTDEGRAAYGANGEDGQVDPASRTFAAHVVEKAEAAGVDFSAYATNGKLPLVAIVFAGPGEQSSTEEGCSDYLWAKFFNTSSITTADGNTSIGSFLLSDEVIQEYGTSANDVVATHFEGIALFCHEFSHALGLPDFYYTGSDAAIDASLRTMDYWSILDYGQYYYNGYFPPGYTAFERSSLGWLDVKELTEPQFARLYGFDHQAEGPAAYVIRNPQNPAEFYLLENRQPSTWYAKAMGSGMLITHIDYDAEVWNANTVNNDPDHPRMQYVPADNVKDGHTLSASLSLSQLLAGYKGDLFPGTTGATEFSDETTPAATLFTGTEPYLSRPLYNITLTDDGIVTFSFRDASLSGIDNAPLDGDAATEQVFTLSGQRITTTDGAAPGIYVVRSGHAVRKVVVK